MKIPYTIHIDGNIQVNDLEYHTQGPYAGYITAYTTICGKHIRETVFRVHDSRATSDMTLARINYSHLHPILRRYWQDIEQRFIGICEMCKIGPAPIVKEGSKK